MLMRESFRDNRNLLPKHINAVTARGGKSTQDPPHPSGAFHTNNAGEGQEKTSDT